jgi:hypothetical protein
MSDPLRHDASPVRPGSDVDADVGRETRIEELLLAGLDHYFAAQYEEAINVWTRVLFLDRGHARARAYIERARGAVAERHRESEELLHRGVAAFNDGDADAARLLLTRAVERGVCGAEALAVLGRLDRLEAPAEEARLGPAAAGARAERGAVPGSAAPPDPAASQRSHRHAWVLALAGVAAVALVAFGAWRLPDIDLALGSVGRSPDPRVGARAPLPVPGASDIALARARALYDRGRLRESAVALEAIRPDDPLGGEADALRAAIQRALLATAGSRGLPLPETGEVKR